MFGGHGGAMTFITFVNRIFPFVIFPEGYGMSSCLLAYRKQAFQMLSKQRKESKGCQRKHDCCPTSGSLSKDLSAKNCDIKKKSYYFMVSRLIYLFTYLQHCKHMVICLVLLMVEVLDVLGHLAIGTCTNCCR